jgi:hypothetical protein
LATNDAEGVWMNARYNGKCGECYEPIEEGDRIVYMTREKCALCASCGEARIGKDPLQELKELEDFI